MQPQAVKNSIKNSPAPDFVTPHGVFLAIFDKGVLLQGPSGCGKSECALALLDRHHQLICDDAPIFVKTKEQIIGRSPTPLQNLLEIRGLGIIDVKQLFGVNAIQQAKRLDLIIELVRGSESHERPISMKLVNNYILDMPIPSLVLPLNFKLNMAILIETAVRLAFTCPSLGA